MTSQEHKITNGDGRKLHDFIVIQTPITLDWNIATVQYFVPINPTPSETE